MKKLIFLIIALLVNTVSACEESKVVSSNLEFIYSENEKCGLLKCTIRNPRLKNPMYITSICATIEKDYRLCTWSNKKFTSLQVLKTEENEYDVTIEQCN